MKIRPYQWLSFYKFLLFTFNTKSITCNNSNSNAPIQRWFNWQGKLDHLWNEKAQFISGYIYENHQLDIPISTINPLLDSGCWCQSSNRNSTFRGRTRHQFDKICQRYHNCLRCTELRSCEGGNGNGNDNNNNNNQKSIFRTILRGQSRSPRFEGKELFPNHDRAKVMKCNTRNSCC